jgi:DNA-binding response OmpR family regulator
MRILIAEDKRAMAEQIGRALEREGHSVSLAFDGAQALRLALDSAFDLLLLDVMLPRIDGFTVIQKLRDAGRAVQTIIISARDTMQDIVHGLDSGADDYLTKPFALDVLIAKVRAAERRLPSSGAEPITFADLLLNPKTHELMRGERTVLLTRTEFKLLESLMRRARTVVPHATLLEEGWRGETEVSFDSLYVLIRALRSKITQPGEPELLHTVRGVGYCLRQEGA